MIIIKEIMDRISIIPILANLGKKRLEILLEGSQVFGVGVTIAHNGTEERHCIRATRNLYN